MQAHVHRELVDGALQKGRIHRDHRALAGHRQSRCQTDGMLLGDSDIDHSVGELFGHLLEPCGGHHRRTDTLEGLSGCDIERRYAVELVEFVGDGGLVAVSLLGHDVDDHRLVELLGTPEGLLQQRDVVTVDPAGVFEPERVEHGRRLDDLFDRLLESHGELVGGVSDDRHGPEHPSGGSLRPFVSGIESQTGQACEHRQPTHRRGVGAAVVVEHHDQPLWPEHRQVAESLVGLPAGEGAITDHCDGPPVSSPEGVAEGVADGGRRVAVLDEVVLALGACGISTHTAERPQVVEPVPSTGEQFVDVCLVSDVPEDAVGGRLECPVERDGELDDPEIRREVAPGPRDAVEQE